MYGDKQLLVGNSEQQINQTGMCLTHIVGAETPRWPYSTAVIVKKTIITSHKLRVSPHPAGITVAEDSDMGSGLGFTHRKTMVQFCQSKGK